MVDDVKLSRPLSVVLHVAVATELYHLTRLRGVKLLSGNIV